MQALGTQNDRSYKPPTLGLRRMESCDPFLLWSLQSEGRRPKAFEGPGRPATPAAVVLEAIRYQPANTGTCRANSAGTLVLMAPRAYYAGYLGRRSFHESPNNARRVTALRVGDVTLSMPARPVTFFWSAAGHSMELESLQRPVRSSTILAL